MYYQRKLDIDLFDSKYAVISATSSSNAYRNILDILERNSDTILGTKNPDIIAEVGIAFRLCGREHKLVCQRCVDFIRSCVRYCGLERRTLLYSPNTSTSRGLRRSEHSNCLGLLL